MYIENLKIKLAAKYFIQGKGKTKGTYHEDAVGDIQINYGVDSEKLDTLLETLHGLFENDPVELQVSFTAAND